jgi:acetylornithine deacetylase/succinyl-diaminopimelate desuccinylase-like protein
LNFTPIQNVKGFHGIDERIGITDLNRTVGFYKQIIKE